MPQNETDKSLFRAQNTLFGVRNCRMATTARMQRFKSLRVLFPAPWGEKKMNKVPVEYPAFERNEKVER